MIALNVCNKPFKCLGSPLVDECGLVRACRGYTHKIFKKEKIKRERKVENLFKFLKHAQIYTRKNCAHLANK